MTDDERYDRGLDIIARIHGSVVPATPREKGTFPEIAVRNIYNDVWGREEMSVRDRRLMVIGALAAMTLMDPLEIHLRSALELEELSWNELNEFVITMSSYIGAPRATYVHNLI